MERASAGLDKLVAFAVRKAPANSRPELAWPLACGSAVAARTRTLGFEGGVLRVEVPDAGWRRELQGLAARYVAQLNRVAAVEVCRLEFVVREQRGDPQPALPEPLQVDGKRGRRHEE